MVPTGLGSRWHLMGREIPRAIAENRTMRLWDPRKSGAFGCIYLRSSECPEASERCYFQTVDGCPQVDIWNVPDKPRRMASWRQGKVPLPPCPNTGLSKDGDPVFPHFGAFLEPSFLWFQSNNSNRECATPQHGTASPRRRSGIGPPGERCGKGRQGEPDVQRAS